MRGLRLIWIGLVVLLVINTPLAGALDMKNTRGRPTPNLADEWDGRWAAATAQQFAKLRQHQAEQTPMAGFITAALLIVGLLAWLAAKFRIWEMHSTLVNLNTLGNGWLLKWATRWGAF